MVLAQDLLRSTYILGIRQGSPLAGITDGVRNGGYELADGTWISFDPWYRNDWRAVFIDMLTQTSDDFGIMWTLGTGERGEKYVIDPSLMLGFIAQVHPKPNSTLSLTVTTTFGGGLTELPCVADYGAIGGIQTVNCRLAATVIPPAETLQYLLKGDVSKLSVRLTFGASF